LVNKQKILDAKKASAKQQSEVPKSYQQFCSHRYLNRVFCVTGKIKGFFARNFINIEANKMPVIHSQNCQ